MVPRPTNLGKLEDCSEKIDKLSLLYIQIIESISNRLIGLHETFETFAL